MNAERRATAVAVLVAATYFMELLDGTPTQLPLESDDDEDA